jgi:hypothetical protein
VSTVAKLYRVRQPIQPLVIASDGVLRFQENAIVRYLLDHGGIDMNALAGMDFKRSDWQQFAQLIGYSHSGWGTLSYANDRIYNTALERYWRRLEKAQQIEDCDHD